MGRGSNGNRKERRENGGERTERIPTERGEKGEVKRECVSKKRVKAGKQSTKSCLQAIGKEIPVNLTVPKIAERRGLPSDQA